MPTSLLEDYSYVRSREPESTFGNVDVLNLVEEMIRTPGDHHWEVYASGVLPPGESDVYYLIVSGSDPAQPNQRVAFLVDDTSFWVGYDPDGTVDWNDDADDFVHDGAFSGLRTLAGSDLELVGGQLQPASLNLGDLGPIRVWLAEHREINECDSPCSVGRAASLTLLIEKVEPNETDNSFVYGAHVGRVLSRMDLNDEDKGIYGDAALVGKPATPGKLGPEAPVSDPDYQSWLGQPNNAGGSVVRTGLTEWSPAYGVGWDNHLPNGSMRNVGARKRLVPYGVNGVEEGYDGGWLMVSSGNRHSLGIQKDGTLWAWGDNFYGQLGIGDSGGDVNTFQDPPDSNEPVQVIIPPGHPGTWRHVSAGDDYSLGIDSNGKGWAWGSNVNGRTGLNTESGNTIFPTALIVGGATNAPATWKQLSAGSNHSLGIAFDDTAWAWGSNAEGRTGLNTGASSNTLSPTAVRVDLSDPAGHPGTWKQLSAGGAHSLGIDSNDKGWAWGRGSSGQLGTGFTNNRLVPNAISTNDVLKWKQLSAGDAYSLGISKDMANDNVGWSWGTNIQARTGLNIDNSTNTPFPTAVRVDLSNPAGHPGTWKQLSAGQYSLGIDSNDKGWAWGSNLSGRTGLNVDTGVAQVPTAVFVGGTTDAPQAWKQLSAAAFHSLGISANNSIWAWGFNNLGQLGIGNQDNKSVPNNILYAIKIYNDYLHGEVGRTKYLRQFGTEPLDHGVKFVTTTLSSLQAWLPLGNGSNQLILWRRRDNNDDEEIEDNGGEDPENDL